MPDWEKLFREATRRASTLETDRNDLRWQLRNTEILQRRNRDRVAALEADLTRVRARAQRDTTTHGGPSRDR